MGGAAGVNGDGIERWRQTGILGVRRRRVLVIERREIGVNPYPGIIVLIINPSYHEVQGRQGGRTGRRAAGSWLKRRVQDGHRASTVGADSPGQCAAVEETDVGVPPPLNVFL